MTRRASYPALIVALILMGYLLIRVAGTVPENADEPESVQLCEDAACCFIEPAGPAGVIRAGFISALEKVYSESPYCRRERIQPAGQLALAGNEYESLQVVLLAPRDIQDVSLSTRAFTLSRRAADPVDLDVKVRVVAHVSQVRPKIKTSRIGWQPDPLLPNQPVDLYKGEPQAFLVTVRSTANTPAGTYAGKIEVRANGELLASLDLAIDLWNFDLPQSSKFKTASFPTYAIADSLWPAALGYAPANDEMKMSRFLRLAELGFTNRLPPLGFIANGLESRDKYGESLTRPGFPLYTGGKGNLSFDRARTDRLVEYLQSRNANHFFIGFTSDIYKHPQLAAQREDSLLRYLREYRDYLKDEGLSDQVYLYNIDEPWGAAVENAKRIYRLVKKEVGDDFRIMQNTNQNNDAIIGELLGYFDVLDINLGFFDINAMDDYRRRHPEDLAEVWWNLNLWPDARPNLFLEYPLIDARILGPMSFRYRIQGFEYWHMASLYGVGNYYPLSASALKIDWRVGEESLDGLLVYPNDKFGFFSSLRLESFRDGMEDQEYLYLLKALDPRNPLLEVPVVSGIHDYENDAQVYLAYRRQLGRSIERLMAASAQVPLH